MKSEEIKENNPIKDKYTKNIGFFKKIQIKFNDFKHSIKKNKELKKDFDSLISMAVSIISYGTLGILALSLFSVPITILGFFGIGSLLWLIENKFIDFITRIIGSIKLVDIN